MGTDDEGVQVMASFFTKAEAHQFWRNPDEDNKPEKYLADDGQSNYLHTIVERYIDPTEAILEVGCNAGRNLNRLHRGGYRNLHGIEINEHAASVFALHYPETFTIVDLKIGAAEDILPQYPADSLSLVYTVAVLEHISNESHVVAINMVRVTKKNGFIITIEDETAATDRHVPRNYKMAFEDLGCKQVFSEYTPANMGTKLSKFVTRVFIV